MVKTYVVNRKKYNKITIDAKINLFLNKKWKNKRILKSKYVLRKETTEKWLRFKG